MTKQGTLTVRIVGDAKSFNNAVNGVQGRLNGLGDDFKRIGKQIAAAGAAAAVALGKTAVDNASALEQSFGAVETVFGSASDTIAAFAATAANSAGLSTRAVNEMAAKIGASLQGLGFDLGESADLAVQLEMRGADLAATFGGPVDEAVSAIGSLLRGERDPIERYGVSIKQADINARLAADGLDELEGQARRQAEAQTALTLLFEQTARAEGAFARESNTLAGQQERLRAQFEDVTAELGTKLLPHLVKLAVFAGEHLPGAFAFAESAIGTFVGAIQAAARFAADVSLVLEQRLVTEPMRAFRTFADFMSSFWNGFQSVAVTAINNVIGVVETMLQGIRNAVQALRNVANVVPGVNIPDIGNVSLDRYQPPSTNNVTINMPAGADGDDVVRAVTDWTRRNGPLPGGVFA